MRIYFKKVKEFVHGDIGRTEPSICTILNKECDILELDVLVKLTRHLKKFISCYLLKRT
jgi:tRNA U54 and U55 pseudouridine synthase Pus10